MLHTRNLPLLHSKRKLAPRWLGPFRVSARRGTNAYLLDGLPPWMASVHPVFNVSQLKPCNLPDASTPSDQPGRVSPPTGEDETRTEADAPEEFEVDFIRAQRGHGSRRQYLIKWKHFGPEENSWIPEDHLHAPRILQWWREE